MTAARIAAIETLGDRWMIDPSLSPEAVSTSFGRTAPLMLDIGVGNGDATKAWAVDHPDRDVIAVELHRPGIARLIRDLDESGPTNVRVVDGDITTIVDQFEPSSLIAVRILFPDPWPKRRHHKRRLIEPDFVSQVTDVLVPAGQLHIATDWLDYADAMRSAIATEPRLAVEADHDDGPAVDSDGRPLDAPDRWRSNRPDRPVTVYEGRGLEAGRTVSDLVTRRIT